jgi:hypothetical protein
MSSHRYNLRSKVQKYSRSNEEKNWKEFVEWEPTLDTIYVPNRTFLWNTCDGALWLFHCDSGYLRIWNPEIPPPREPAPPSPRENLSIKTKIVCFFKICILLFMILCAQN